MKKLLCLLLLAPAGCYYPAYSVRTAPAGDPPLARVEVERLSSAGVSEGVIDEMLDKRGADKLSPDDLVALTKAGVPDAVVKKMIASERAPVETVVVRDAYPGYYSYYDPYYYPYYGYGWGWGWGWGYSRYHSSGYLGVRSYR